MNYEEKVMDLSEHEKMLSQSDKTIIIKKCNNLCGTKIGLTKYNLVLQ